MGARFVYQACVLSLLAHLIVILLLLRYGDWDKNRDLQKRVTWLDVKPKKNIKHFQSKQKGRVVQTEKESIIEKPKKDSYLGEKNQVVAQETVRHATKSGQVKKNQNIDLSQLGIPLLPGPSVRAADQPQWAQFEASPLEILKGIQESDRTALNTREFIFYGYYQRVRNRLDQAWSPILRQKLERYYQSGHHLVDHSEYTTQVVVTLNSKGEIIRVQLIEESGARDLDDSAIEAFNKAGPFPNPPHGLIDLNQEVRISWNFILRT